MPGLMGDVKSTANTILSLANSIESKILSDGEELTNSPTSFIAHMLDTIGSINAANFYEQAAIRREAIKSTATHKRSLMSYISSKDIASVYGNPSEFIFEMGIKLEDLIKYGVKVTSNMKKVTLNKDMTISITGIPFVMDHNIDIALTKKSVTQDFSTDNCALVAVFNVEPNRVNSNISNPFINSKLIVNDNMEYFVMQLPVRQYTRNYNDFDFLTTSDDLYEFKTSYVGNMYTFEVLHKPYGYDDYVVLHGERDGIWSSGYNFSLANRNIGDKTLSIKFSRDPSRFSPKAGDSIRVIIYTTRGSEGNFTVPDNWEDNIPSISDIVFNPDIDDIYQSALNGIAPILSIGSNESHSGYGEMSLDDLRDKVSKLSDTTLLTIPQIVDMCEKNGLRVVKEQADLLDIYFKISGALKDDMQVYASNALVVRLGKDLPFSTSTSSTILSPISVITLNTSSFNYSTDSNPISFNEYVKRYEERSNIRNFFFPFHMVISKNKVYIDSRVYNTFFNYSRITKYEYFNELSYESGVSKVNIVRNPLNETIDKGVYTGSYNISYRISTNDQILAAYKDFITKGGISPIKVYMEFHNDRGSYLISDDHIQISVYGNSLLVTAIILTDGGVDENDAISVINGSIIPFDGSRDSSGLTYLLDNMCGLRLYTLYRGSPELDVSSKYSNVMTTLDRSLNYHLSTVYDVSNVELVTNITDSIKPIIDLKMDQPPVASYPFDVYDTYTENVPLLDSDNNQVMLDVKLTDGNTVSVPQYSSVYGQVKLDKDGNKVVKHLKGSPIKDDNNSTIFGTVSVDANGGIVIDKKYTVKSYYEVIDLPVVDRIYTVKYNEVIKAFTELKSTVDVLRAPTGTQFRLSLLNTMDGGSYFYKDRSTGKVITIANQLSFEIGMKLVDNVDPTDYTIYITNKIVKYITDNSTTKELSFVKMLNEIKDSTEGIVYFELYKISGYPSGECQTIYLDTNKPSDEVTDIISVRNAITYDSNGNIGFKPDIKINIL